MRSPPGFRRGLHRSVQWSDRDHADEVYTFDEYRLDVRERRVWRGSSLVPMSPKTFDLLVVMVQGAGRLLQKDYLIRSVWPDSFVQDANLSVHISTLRKVLGKSSESQQFIETVPKVGYRLVVPVSRTLTFLDVDRTVRNDPDEAAQVQPAKADSRNEVEIPAEVQPKAASPISAHTGLAQPSLSKRRRLWLIASSLFLCVVVALIVSLLPARAHRTSIVATSTRPLTGTPGEFLQPSFSPDGQELSYTWRSSTGTHQSVYLQSVLSDERKLLADTGSDDYSPVWSPDGSEIAFLHAPSDVQPLELIIARKDKPSLRRRITTICPANDIFRTSPTLSWSPDGHTLVTTDCPAENGSPSLTLISLKTGQKFPLTHPPSRSWDDQAVFSPDGSQIAFRRSRGDASDEIYLVPATGGQERELTFRSSPVDGLAFSRDGKRIVFSSGQATSLGSIWSLNISGGEPVAVTTPLTHTSSPAIAPEGHRMAYVNSPINVSVWRMAIAEHAGTHTGAQRGAEPFISSNFFDASAVYSPDGKSIAFRSDRSGANEIWICRSDGTEPRRITHFDGPMTGSPRWSPDGHLLAFDSRVGGHADVYILHLDGGAPTRMTDSAKTNSDNVVPSWSHDGNAIYFSSNRSGSWQIWRHALNANLNTGPNDGSDIQVTTRGGFNAMETADGRSLIYVANLDHTEIRQLALENHANDRPLASLGAGLWHAWTITRDGLFFVKPSLASSSSSSAATTTLFYLDLKSNRLESLGQAEQVVNDSLSASPDGRWVLFARRSNANTSIMILDGWE